MASIKMGLGNRCSDMAAGVFKCEEVVNKIVSVLSSRRFAETSRYYLP